MFNQPIRLSRPYRTWTGDGAQDSFDTNTAVTIWIAFEPNSPDGEIVVSEFEDVRVGDILEVPYSLEHIGVI